jgi:hypothetical protein
MVFPFSLSTPLQLFPEYYQAFKDGIRILVPGFPLRRDLPASWMLAESFHPNFNFLSHYTHAYGC